MKKLVYLFIVAALIASCKPKGPQYVIKGKISGADSVTFILQERLSGNYIELDSAIAKNGVFTMKGVIDYPQIVFLIAKDSKKGLSFYIENSEITITGNIDSLYDAKITGSKTQDEDSAYQASLKPFEDKNEKLGEEYDIAKNAGDKTRMAELEKENEKSYNEQIAFTKAYIRSHPGSYITPVVLYGINYEFDADEMESIINSLDTNVAKVTLIKTLKDRVIVMKTVSIGQKAPDFALNTPDGKPVALSSKIGSKLLLIDFWASWCGPCRAENPNVVKVYKEFNKKGFDVFGVSLDRTRDPWVKAIADDKLTWTHVSDLQYWSSAAAKLYAVNSIPANFLLDEKGIIIARDLRGEALYNKVKEVLTSK